jgi:two-component system cell cycle sensor histidine kinase/response regulator CckA
MAEMLGYSPVDMLGTELLSYTDEAGAHQGQLLLERGRAGGRVRQDLVLLHKNGRQVHAAVAASPLRDDKGECTGMVAGVVDFTDRRKLEEQLRMAQRMEAVGQLAGGVAHDFNNVLTVILSHVGFLLDEASEPQAREDLSAIEQAARHAESLTRQLLAFSRRQIQKLELLDLEETVADLGKMLRRLIGENIKLVLSAGDGLWPVKADRGQIEQVLMNLAINARDAMPNGGSLTIGLHNVELDEDYASANPEISSGPHVRLAVTDTGVGIPADIRPRIFDPFFTTKGHGKGTGLGLATVYGIVKQSHGAIWVYSEPGEGTSFKIYLPRAEGLPMPAPPPRLASRRPASAATVLVVEDAEPVRQALKRILARQGYRVLEAGHGAEALEICRQHQGSIALMITDIIMPGMGARELANRAVAMRPDLRVLYMSGYTDDAIVHDGVLDPGTPFLEKPFTAEGVLSKIDELLDAGPNDELRDPALHDEASDPTPRNEALDELPARENS